MTALRMTALVLFGPAALVAAGDLLWLLARALFTTLWPARDDDPTVRGPAPDRDDDELALPGLDPAYYSYYLGQAFDDLALVVHGAVASVHEVRSGQLVDGVSYWLRTGDPDLLRVPPLPRPALALTYPVSWAWLAGSYVGIVATLVAAAVVHLVTASLLGLAALFVVGVDLAAGVFSRPRSTCRFCQRFHVRPAFECGNPNGSHLHAGLRPGRFGVFTRRCGCGVEMKTTRFFGRDDLKTKCPDCRRPVFGHLGFSRMLFVPVVGAGAAGKTELLMAMLYVAKEKKTGWLVPAPGEDPAPGDANDKALDNLRRMKVGQPPERTSVLRPLLFRIKRRTFGRRQYVHFYDPMGETYADGEKLPGEPYLANSTAIIFAFDVLPELAPHGDKEIKIRKDGTPAEQPAWQVYHEVHGHLLSQFRRSVLPVPVSQDTVPVPLAVVVTKVDVVRRLAEGIHFNSTGVTGLESRSVKLWLLDDHRPGDIQRVAERIDDEFGTSRYWALSAKDAVHRNSRTDTEGIAELMEWVFRRHTLSRRWVRLR